jgi:hypothetical protein
MTMIVIRASALKTGLKTRRSGKKCAAAFYFINEILRNFIRRAVHEEIGLHIAQKYSIIYAIF